MRHWKMYTNSYLEARIKVAYCRGTASSFWLYGGVGGSSPANGRFFEIDMFETGYDDETKLGTNLHYGHSYEPFHYKDPKSFVFRDEEGNDVNLHEQFLTYGIELTDSQMKMFLNGVQYAVYNFAPLIPNNPISYFKQPLPFNIRFGESSSLVSGNPSDCNDLPKDMLVDYVRLYRKNTVEAIKINTTNMTLCTQAGGRNVQVDYYPGVTYQWASTPFFNFELNPNGLEDCNCSRWWVTIQPGTPPDDYSIPLSIFLPCGGTETKTLNIKVLDKGNPNTPTHIYLLRDNNGILRPGVWKASETTAYQWSSNGGQSWETVQNLPQGSYNIWNTHVILPQSQSYYVNLCVRALNVCGESPTYCENIYVPSGVCWWCPSGLLMAPTDVMVERIPNSEKYQLKVQTSAPADSYEWSYDQDYWNVVTNSTPGSSFYGYNYFGELDSRTPPFLIHVRAKQLDTLSDIYTKLIELPEPVMPISTPSGPILDLPLVETNHSLERMVPFEEAEESFDPIYIFNVYGQMVKTGDDRQNLIQEIKELFPAGLYFLVEQSTMANKKTVTKLFITR